MDVALIWGIIEAFVVVITLVGVGVRLARRGRAEVSSGRGGEHVINAPRCNGGTTAPPGRVPAAPPGQELLLQRPQCTGPSTPAGTTAPSGCVPAGPSEQESHLQRPQHTGPSTPGHATVGDDSEAELGVGPANELKRGIHDHRNMGVALIRGMLDVFPADCPLIGVRILSLWHEHVINAPRYNGGTTAPSGRVPAGPSEPERHLQRPQHTDPSTPGHVTVSGGSEAEVRVISATEWKRGDDIYPMERKPRGRCIIINNYEFADPEAHRAGSELDVRRMEELFTAFHFECTTYANLSAREMMDLLSAKAQAEQQKAADCLVVILMSHGDRGTIYGVDEEELLLDDIYEKFNNSNCPSLQGKPKLFFVQTCRGRKSDIGTNEYVAPDTADAGRIPANAGSEACARDAPPRRRASYSDIYICYPSVPGYESLRYPATGALYLTAVYRVFSQHACTMHLEKLMYRVNEEVISHFTRDGCCQTPSGDPRGWRKKLYFNPGLFVECTA